MRQADAILMADVHRSDETPVCRTDNYLEAQNKKLLFVKKLQKEHDCIVLCAGDLLDYWKSSPRLITMTIRYLPKKFYCIYGQHDLPQHSLDLAEKSGTFTLAEGRHLALLAGAHFGQDPAGHSIEIKDRKILVWHKLVWTGRTPWPGCTDPTAETVMKQYPKYDLILTGDNHKPFVVEKNGRLLVNPGSVMRSTTDQVNHKPRVYLYYADDNTVEPVFLPIEAGVISQDHITKQKERDERINAFISRVGEEFEIGLSFEENLIRFEQANKIHKSISTIIRKAME